MATYCDKGTCGWLEEKVPEEFANYGGLSGADRARGDYSSRL
jgi:hypothetical protein